MKILFLSYWGSAVPLAMHCQDSGHEVRFYIEDEESQEVGDGFVPKIDDYKESESWCDYVITDDSSFGKVNDALRKKGIPVIGGSVMTDALEEDRHLGQELFKSVGLKVPESNAFKATEEAIAYVQENPKKYVIKLSGSAQNDKTTTYVGQAEDGSDIPPVLEHFAKKFSKGLESVEIQEMVEGMEVAVSAFFNGERFIGPCQLNFEHKKLMPGVSAAGWGPNTGEMGTTALWCEQTAKIFQVLIAPFEKPLKEMGYHGDFDVNAILDESGDLHPLEMTNRFGWPALSMQIETLKENDLGELFYALASGQDYDIQTTAPLSLCLVIGVPPLPYMNKEILDKYSKDMPVVFRDGSAREGMYPGECKLVDDVWTVAGTAGCLAVVAAGGYSISECQKIAYDLADQIIVPNKMVRIDIGDQTAVSILKLKKLGFLDSAFQEVV